MTVTTPSTDAEATAINGRITALTTLIANNSANGALIASHTAEKAQQQRNLVAHLMATGKLNAATILAGEAYGT